MELQEMIDELEEVKPMCIIQVVALSLF